MEQYEVLWNINKAGSPLKYNHIITTQPQTTLLKCQQLRVSQRNIWYV